MHSNLDDLKTWDKLMKLLVWRQLGDIRGKKILDFGSGQGITADYLAEHNEVIAVEPSEESIGARWQNHTYQQFRGSTEILRTMEDESFDIILCHNVLEYAADRDEITREFARLLKPDGFISLVKHNRPGRVMQVAFCHHLIIKKNL